MGKSACGETDSSVSLYPIRPLSYLSNQLSSKNESWARVYRAYKSGEHLWREILGKKCVWRSGSSVCVYSTACVCVCVRLRLQGWRRLAPPKVAHNHTNRLYTLHCRCVGRVEGVFQSFGRCCPESSRHIAVGVDSEHRTPSHPSRLASIVTRHEVPSLERRASLAASGCARPYCEQR